jgi:hypothetical protein
LSSKEKGRDEDEGEGERREGESGVRESSAQRRREALYLVY